MTLEEAVAAFESQMTVHEAVGYPVGNYDGPKDMSRAPTGETYITLATGGIARPAVCIWCNDEEDAIALWLRDAEVYAAARGRQLYWRDRPIMLTQTFVAVNQAEAMQDQRLRDSLSVELHTVWGRLLVSTKGPDGKVIDVIEDQG